MHFQLREYTIVDGRLDDFIQIWRESILPLRLSLGFSAFGPWVERDASRFVWLVGFDGDIRAANEAYYASPGRIAMDPDPAPLIVEARNVWLEAL